MLLLFAAVPALSQVSLRWKLQPGEVLTYKADMKELDTNQARANFGRILFGKDSGGTRYLFDTVLKNLQKEVVNAGLIVNLSEKKSGLIGIAMKFDLKKQTEDTTSLLQMMGRGVMLRGAINEDGTIQSFYVKNDQRNLIALLFELPGKPIQVGDSWPLDVHLISMDQNFSCDSSFRKNKVTLVDLKKSGDDTIAVIQYDLVEYVSGGFESPFSANSSTPTFMRMTHKAQAEFSVNRGRWLSYDGLMTMQAGGIMESNIVKEMRLVAQ